MKVSGTTHVWLASRNLLLGQGKEFFHRLTKAEKTFEVEDIHDLRVASRRLREAIALFAPCFPAGNFSALEKRVKKITRLLGTMRNTDEAIIFFSSLTPEESASADACLSQLLALLNDEREVARKKVKRGLKEFSPEPFMEEYQSARDRPIIFEDCEKDPFTEIRSYAREAFLARAAAVAELWPLAKEEKETAAQHQLRIAVKRERYRLEIIAPLLHGGYEECHSCLKKYQEVLGKMHDMDVFSEMVRERIKEEESCSALLKIIGARRSGFFHAFHKLLTLAPLDSVGERAAKAL